MPKQTLAILTFLALPILSMGEQDAEQAPEPPPAPEPVKVEKPESIEYPIALPFAVGEKLYYDLEWGIFTVGQAVMQVSEPEIINERPCLKFSLSVRTQGLAEKLYKVRTTITGWVDLEMKETHYYTKKQLEGDTHRDIEVRFDDENQKAYYFNWGKMEEPCEIEAGTFDPLSAIFFFRMFDLIEGQSYKFPVTDGKKVVEGKVNVAEKEICEVPAGLFWAYKVEPSLEGVGGVFKKSKDASMEIWLSDDQYKVPVMMSSEVAVGKFRAILVDIENTDRNGVPSGMATATKDELKKQKKETRSRVRRR